MDIAPHGHICTQPTQEGLEGFEHHSKSISKLTVHVTASKPHARRETNGWDIIRVEETLSSSEQIAKLPSFENLICILQKCRKEKNLVLAQLVHAHIRNHGLEAHRMLGNYLVPMFVECGSMSDAHEVFHRLVYRNEYSWTSLIHGYIECGAPQHALDLYPKMRQECVYPSRYTLLALLKACAALSSLSKSREIHGEIVEAGFEGDNFIGNALVDVYAKCGSLGEAQEVFEKLAVRDVISWSALISGYAEHSLGEEALKFLEEMQQEGLSPNAVTFVSCLKACSSLGAIDKGRKLHVRVVKEGLETNTFVGNTLVDFYAKGGSLVEAQDVFNELRVKDVVSWNALISGYAEQGWGEQALDCLKYMQLEGVSPDAVTFMCSLKSCGSLGAIDRGREIHVDIARKKLERDVYVGSTLVDMYAKCRSLAEAQDVFDKLPAQGLVSWNALIAGYAKCGALAEAQELFERMPTRDVVSWNTLVAGYAEHGLLEKALSCLEHMQFQGMLPSVISWNSIILGYAEGGESEKPFKLYLQMQEQGLLPDAVTFMSIFKACGHKAALDIGKKVHAQVHRVGRLEATTILDMYAKCGSMEDAQELFDAMPTRDLVGWTALIAGYARQGKNELVFLSFEKMETEGIQPDGIALLHVLTACSHAGLVKKGQKYFEALSKVPGFSPTLMHYNCMINLLGRAGQLDAAMAMLKKMPYQPDLATWNTMLGACRKWGNVDLGNQAFANAVSLDEKYAETYMSMANIYADAHMWEEAKKVEVMRLNIHASEEVGKSWIDIDGFVHSFVMGDTRHLQGKELYEGLKHCSMT